MHIISYDEKYREEVRQVCIDTGSADNQINPEHRAFTLWMYCDPYLDHGTAFLLMNEDEVKGYILCAEDIRKFENDFMPYKEKIMKECPHFRSRLDFSVYEKYADIYPAHLHIDIEEKYTGHGSGTSLMRALVNSLKKKQVKGLMVGVGKDNQRAFAFYQKCGFHILEEDEMSAVLGMKIKKES